MDSRIKMIPLMEMMILNNGVSILVLMDSRIKITLSPLILREL